MSVTDCANLKVQYNVMSTVFDLKIIFLQLSSILKLTIYRVEDIGLLSFFLYIAYLAT